MYSNSDPHLMWVTELRLSVVLIGQLVIIMYVFYAATLVSAGHVRFLITLPGLCGLVALTPLFIRRDEVVYFLAYSLSVGFISSLRVLGFAYGHGPLAPLGVPNNGLAFYATAALPINIVSTSAKVPEETVEDVSPVKVKDNTTTARAPLKGTTESEDAIPEVDVDAIRKAPSRLPSTTSQLAHCGIKAAVAYSMTQFAPDDIIPVLFRQEVLPPYKLLIVCLWFSAVSDALGLVASRLFNITVGPSFDRPYIITSLRDFWGRRWCLPVAQTLRTTVYEPIVQVLQALMGLSIAKHIARCIVFCVTGVVGEMLYRLVWEREYAYLLFFMLQGLLVAVEEISRNFGRDEANSWATGSMAFLKLYYTARYTVFA
ncbi:hypothetical protein, variant [Sphaeroforma arctica JP610]|nr:hypothetical protein, variant [Sphaeroforma arctica JP610]KNC86605.1 hypothetical protein, variant [Sphaeroforma arctica JP610]|eukprot:XP_014160507.1 hypothetical protein, variant [Sphaeroforma arctica JP610]